MTTRRIELIEEKAKSLKGKRCTIGTSQATFLVQDYTYKEGQLTLITDRKTFVYDAASALKALEEFKPVPETLPTPASTQEPAEEETPMAPTDLLKLLEPLAGQYRELKDTLANLEHAVENNYRVELYYNRTMDEEFSATVYRMAVAHTQEKLRATEQVFNQTLSSYLAQVSI